MHVLIATDGSKQSLAAARYLRSVADPATVAKVTVLAVIRPLAAVAFANELTEPRRARMDQQWEQHSFRKAAEEATGIIAAELEDWAPEVQTRIWSGSPASQIIKAAKQLDIGLIVVASGGAGVTESVLMGSTAHRVLNYAPCPVLVVRRGRRR